MRYQKGMQNSIWFLPFRQISNSMSDYGKCLWNLIYFKIIKNPTKFQKTRW